MRSHRLFNWSLWRVFLIPFFISGCATYSPIAYVSKGNEIALKDLCERYKVVWQLDSISEVITLRYNDIQAKTIIGSDIVIVDDHRVQLSTPVSISHSAIVVPIDFKRNVIDLMRDEAGTPVDYGFKKIHEIIIDAGHGGKDPGALGLRGTREKEVVLRISKLLERMLEREGFKVRLTRSRDDFISLKERTEVASRSDVDLFISIHANASPDKRASGIEVFSLKNLVHAERNDEQRELNHRKIFKQIKMTKQNNDLKEILEDMFYTKKQSDSAVLASIVASNMAQYTRARNRGQKTANFYVLRNTVVPAILVEVGFLTNAKEEGLLTSRSYQQKIAKGLTRGILEYSNGKQ